MNEDNPLSRQGRRSGVEKPAPAVPYTTKDFQFEVLSKLGEMGSLAESLEESWESKLESIGEQRLLKFDSRTLMALGAIALSVAGYVVQDARNSARLDSEIEATKARMMRLEQIAAANTEGRIRTEVQLGELREGQAEIKAMIQTRDSTSKKLPPRK